MELNKCVKCGSFFASDGALCPRCEMNEQRELSTVQSYVEENGMVQDINVASLETGISVKNISKVINDENGQGSFETL